MKILIVYGTVEGQSRKIARFLEDIWQEAGHPVVLADASDEAPAPEKYDAVLIGSSVHMHKYNSAVRDYATQHAAALNGMHSAFFSVSMAIASHLPEEHQEVEKITADFLEQCGWKPTTTVQWAGALKYTQYDFFKRLIMRMIAKREGGSTDTSQDHEYTDWDAVRTFAADFIARASQRN